MKIKLSALLSAAILHVFLLTQPAQATDYTFSQTLDLSQATVYDYDTRSTVYSQFSLPLTTFTLNVGDTISGTISFDSGQSITVDNLEGPSFILLNFLPGYSDFGPNDTSTSHITLTGVTGNLDAPNPSSYSESGDGLGATDSSNVATSFSFTGLTYEITVADLISSPENESPYDFQVYTGDGTVSVNLPEPNSWALLLVGACLLPFCLRVPWFSFFTS